MRVMSTPPGHVATLAQACVAFPQHLLHGVFLSSRGEIQSDESRIEGEHDGDGKDEKDHR